MIKSVYVHIPFCKNICSYCDFCKMYYNNKYVDKYLDALKREIKDNYKNEIIDTIYIGGGTPSSLSYDELKKLFKTLKIFNLNKDYEFTFECNYEDINEKLLVLLKNNKVNRLSIGLQTFNNKYESFLNRKINKKEMIEKVNLSKKYFENINVDLMYAFKSQSIEELLNDLNIFLKLDATHISIYSLIIEKNTMLYINNISELDDDIQSIMYYKIVNILKEKGYIHYEISNFSKKGYLSKHNLTYWNNSNYYGFGLGSSGFIDNVRYSNTKNILDYINNRNIVLEYQNISKDQMVDDEVMLNLRKINGINKKEFYSKYKKSFYDLFNIDFLFDNNLLIDDGNNIYIPEDKIFISNEIIVNILDNKL